MPNQLSESKRRMTLAEHCGVLAVLHELARCEDLTITDLLRQSARNLIAIRASDEKTASTLRSIIMKHAPEMPSKFRSRAHVNHFKRQQREFDQLLQDLNLADPSDLQNRNSVVGGHQNVRLPTRENQF